MKQVAVSFTGARFESQAMALAERLSLPLADDTPGQEDRLLLVVSTEGLTLRLNGSAAPGPVAVDFVHGKAAHRRRFGGGRNIPLARAIGLKGRKTPRVIDATAGLGRDAFVLATLGCSVTLVEQSPILHALLEDGLQRAALDAETRPITRRMTLVCADARNYLKELPASDRPDAVYLDPMYPHRDKSARVKKEMQLLQQLLGTDQHGAELLQVARRAIRQRVVVKRPSKAGWLGGEQPAFHLASPNTRYDVYLPRSNP